MLKNKISTSIAVGQAQSGTILTNEYILTGMVFTGSATVTGSQVSFLVSVDGTNYYPLFDYNGTEITVPVSGSAKAYNLNHEVFESWNFAKLRLGFSASSVAQATNALLVDFVVAQD